MTERRFFTLNRTYRNRLRPWETAALIALCVTLLSGLWAQRRQSGLASGLVRLHVIAHSDSEADQAVKLKVRDAVLSLLAPRLEGVTDAAEAEAIVRAALPELAAEAAHVSSQHAEAALGREIYPTRAYEGFALPAGVYTSLRITLGEGRGHNWWCVIYPPLCTAAASGTLETSALDGEDLKLITGADGTCVFKFRVIEWWENLTARWDA